MEGYKITEEKVRKAKPVIERILSRKHGRNIKLLELTVGGVTIRDDDCAR